MTSRNGKENILLALAIGALFGAGAALLLAPQSGEKTRRDIRRLGRRARDKAEALKTQLTDSIDHMAEGVWDKIQEDFDRGREWTDQTLADLQKALDSGKEFISGEIDRIRNS
jgi:gas vesicle protein